MLSYLQQALCGLARFQAVRQLLAQLPLIRIFSSDAAKEPALASQASVHAEFRRRGEQLIRACYGQLLTEMDKEVESKESCVAPPRCARI